MIVFDMCICSGNPIVTLTVTDAQSTEEMIAIQTYKMFGSNEITSSDMKTLPQRDTCCGMESSSIVKRPEMTTLLTSQQSIGFREDAFPRVGLDRRTALSFLHRDTLRLPDAPLGYLTVCYGDHPLGFVKNIGNRCNNLHPQERRIRMNITDLK